jgi:hypothetical protein
MAHAVPAIASSLPQMEKRDVVQSIYAMMVPVALGEIILEI